jgi:hypothetical protein
VPATARNPGRLAGGRGIVFYRGSLVPVFVLEKKLPCCPTFFDFDYDYEHQFKEHDHDPNVTIL